MTAQQTRPPRDDSAADADSLGEVVDMVKAYALQETVGPLKGAGKWLAMGAIGAFLLGVGLSMIVLGLLRLMQVEWTTSATGSWSWVAYLIALVVTVGFAALALTRINRDSLNKEPK
jgi:uncharacterized membrane protein YidH (DUF202 family)